MRGGFNGVVLQGGRDAFRAVDYAARTAAEPRADIVKVNRLSAGRSPNVPKEYQVGVPVAEQLGGAVRSAGRTLVLFSGGDHVDADVLLDRARVAMGAGVLELIFRRGVLERERADALGLVGKLHEVPANSVPE